jgi:hypothetical protein
MALKFLNYNRIEPGKKIILPRCANLYHLDFSKNKIEFYHSNPKTKGIELNTWNLHKNAREIDFEFIEDRVGGHIIIPRFYDNKGNLLKIGNR